MLKQMESDKTLLNAIHRQLYHYSHSVNETDCKDGRPRLQLVVPSYFIHWLAKAAMAEYLM